MRRDAERLQDILESLDSVADMIKGRTEAEFLADMPFVMRWLID